MTVRDLIVELVENCPNKDSEVVIKVDGDILHRIVGVYLDGYYYIVEVD